MTETPFPVFFASIQTIPGVAIALGGITYFAPIDDDRVHVITDSAALLVTGQIPEPMATYVRGELAQKFQQSVPHLSQRGA